MAATTKRKPSPKKAKEIGVIAIPKKKTSKPGVIASIVEYLEKATKDKPITKKQIVTRLKKRFPDREETALARTINCQVPSRLLSDKGLKVRSDKETPRGYWIA